MAEPANGDGLDPPYCICLAQSGPRKRSGLPRQCRRNCCEISPVRSRDCSANERSAARGILVPHDAYQYFGQRYDVQAVGTISLSDAASPNPAQIDELRDLVREGSSACTAISDPMGTAFAPGPEHYEQTLRAIAADYAQCLGG
jgi:ABC-type Zn2+ transport system substrate-binding protein/surface adhesin